jgi:hypothetical protein
MADSDNTAFASDSFCPKPNLFAAEKSDVGQVGFIGDSITQGIGTQSDGYEFLVAKIWKNLGNHYATWNIGLDFAVAKDAASDGAWFYRAKKCDKIAICLGVNDLLHGATGMEIFLNLNKAVVLIKNSNSDCQIVAFTVPPLDSTEHLEMWLPFFLNINNA